MRKILFIVALLYAAVSCQRAPIRETGGCLCLHAALQGPSVKSCDETADLLSGAVVNIYNGDFSGLVRSYGYTEVPAQIWLPCSRYRVDVVAGEAAKPEPRQACWESRSFFGSEYVDIRAGICTNASITAAVSSISSIICFSPSVKENFRQGYCCTVELNGDSIVYDSSTDGKEACFIPTGSEETGFVWKFEGTTLNGKTISRTGIIPGILAGKLYRLSFGYSVTEGNLVPDIIVDDWINVIDGTIVFDSGSSGMSGIPEKDIWARHVEVSATVDTDGSSENPEVVFSYSSDGQNWTARPATTDGDGIYRAVLDGLEPGTEYSCMILVNGEQKGDALKFTTADAPQIPNGSFEYTSKSASGNYQEFYGASQQHWWGSGNGSDGITGSADFGSFVICKPDTSEKVDGDQSACLVSQWALVKFAAGNLFSGYFGGLVGTKGGKVYFGRPFTGRPSALKVWVKYSGGRIDRVDGTPDGVTVIQNQTYDTGRIQIALGNWDYRKYGGTRECPILVNTTDKSSFVDFATDKSTIASGDLQLQSDQSGKYNTWAEYTIPLIYSDTATMPSYIVVSCASSIYGDYFTGCSSSKMWIDKMELVYE
ncbi:MAG: PCMD domain-containing protein [Bacteroidales bacterium]|nr:PCMD domain-containing protein [Bacteroidales bacterium]